MTDDFEHEVVSLHQFFQGWMNGDIEASEGEYGRLRQALAEGFTMMTPAGVQVGRDELLESMWLAHGKHADDPLRIEIRNVSMRPLEGELWVAVYQAVEKPSTAASHDSPGRRHARRAVLSGRGGRFRRLSVAFLAPTNRASPRYDAFSTACYEEWHELGGAKSGRRSTAILGRDAEAPRGVLWIRLSETTI